MCLLIYVFIVYLEISFIFRTQMCPYMYMLIFLATFILNN